MIRILTILLFLFYFSSCCSYDKKDFDFNKNDLLPFSSFKVGDTIYYENLLGDIDTILIHKIDSIQNKNCGGLMAMPAGNYLYIAIKHLPNDQLWTGTTTDATTGKTEINYQEIISIDKIPQTKEMSYSIDFKDFHTSAGENNIFEKLRTDTVIINGKNITNFYEVEHGYPERLTKPTNIELLYWTDNDGLIAYKNKQGEWWTKKSFPSNQAK
jgi:hypothetical protein